MKKVNPLILLFILTASAGAAEPGFSFTSAPLQFSPLAAHTFEPRLGLIWHADDNRLRLDIGNSVDLVQYLFDAPQRRIAIGSDFFTYTLLSGEKNFHFPVDAVDYLFGFNASYVDTMQDGIFSTRLRLSHISAHFVDGHFDGGTGVWKDGLNPRVYSREFLELTCAYEPVSAVRGYIGFMYLWHVDPTTLPTTLAYAGAEYHQPITDVLDGYAAYQFTVTGVRPRHEFQTGMKLGQWNGRGTKFFFLYHRGNSIHGEYHDRPDEYSGLGFNIDF
jgi:hypothetical protein